MNTTQLSICKLNSGLLFSLLTNEVIPAKLYIKKKTRILFFPLPYFKNVYRQSFNTIQLKNTGVLIERINKPGNIVTQDVFNTS